jgi:hypothetical protein
MVVSLPRGFVSVDGVDGSIEILCVGCRQTIASAAPAGPKEAVAGAARDLEAPDLQAPELEVRELEMSALEVIVVEEQAVEAQILGEADFREMGLGDADLEMPALEATALESTALAVTVIELKASDGTDVVTTDGQGGERDFEEVGVTEPKTRETEVVSAGSDHLDRAGHEAGACDSTRPNPSADTSFEQAAAVADADGPDAVRGDGAPATASPAVEHERHATSGPIAVAAEYTEVENNVHASVAAMFAPAEDVASIRGDAIPRHMLDHLRQLTDRLRLRRA